MGRAEVLSIMEMMVECAFDFIATVSAWYY
jgi:hypothetical protein